MTKLSDSPFLSLYRFYLPHVLTIYNNFPKKVLNSLFPKKGYCPIQTLAPTELYSPNAAKTQFSHENSGNLWYNPCRNAPTKQAAWITSSGSVSGWAGTKDLGRIRNVCWKRSRIGFFRNKIPCQRTSINCILWQAPYRKNGNTKEILRG